MSLWWLALSPPLWTVIAGDGKIETFSICSAAARSFAQEARLGDWRQAEGWPIKEAADR